VFEGCLDDGAPLGLIFRNQDYLQQITDGDLLRHLSASFRLQGRSLMAQYATRYLQLLPEIPSTDYAPSPEETERTTGIRTRSS
jgi:hypothetical protein